MKKIKSSKKIVLTDEEIEQYCQGVENVLTQIRDRCSHKERNKTKKEKKLPEEVMLTLS